MALTRVFIDSRVNDKELIISQFLPGTEYSVLDSSRDGIEQIVSALAGHGGYDSLQIISHGAPGSITIGSTVLNSSTLHSYVAELAQIGRALTENGDLMLYGCNVAHSRQGKDFIEQLAEMTGVFVIASTTKTGASELGGDWILDVCCRPNGEMQPTSNASSRSTALFANAIENYPHILAVESYYGNVITDFSFTYYSGYLFYTDRNYLFELRGVDTGDGTSTNPYLNISSK